MIIQYDTRPDATVDEKLRSLIESIQLAFGEVGIKEDINVTSQSGEIDSISVLLRELRNEVGSYTEAITSIDNRVDTLVDTTIPGIQSDVSGIDGRLHIVEGTTIPGIISAVSALEGKLPYPPVTDGVYKLTVTVTGGTPVYTWEAV